MKIKLGLTGGIGSGKTLVCQIFEKLGVPVYYADTEARNLMCTDPELKAGITEMFGKEAFGKEGLNREYIAGIVFGDRNKLDRLNRMVHPLVRKDFNRWAELQDKVPYVIEEAAILFESGAHTAMDYTVLVHAPEELRIRRVVERDPQRSTARGGAGLCAAPGIGGPGPAVHGAHPGAGRGAPATPDHGGAGRRSDRGPRPA